MSVFDNLGEGRVADFTSETALQALAALISAGALKVAVVSGSTATPYPTAYTPIAPAAANTLVKSTAGRVFAIYVPTQDNDTAKVPLIDANTAAGTGTELMQVEANAPPGYVPNIPVGGIPFTNGIVFQSAGAATAPAVVIFYA